MPVLSLQALVAVGLALGSLLLQGALSARGLVLPLALEAWLTALPGWSVRMLRPSGLAGVALVGCVLAAQYFLLLQLLLRARAWVRPRLRLACLSAAARAPHRPNT